MTWVQRFIIVGFASALMIVLTLLFPIWRQRAEADMKARAAEARANHFCDCECK